RVRPGARRAAHPGDRRRSHGRAGTSGCRHRRPRVHADGRRIERGSVTAVNTTSSGVRPVVHLELHTRDAAAGSAFYACLLGWQPELIEGRSGSYVALDLGRGLGGGIVACGTRRAVWLPYVEVGQVDDSTERARRLGARVLLTPREGPAGWRSVVSTP